MKLGTAIAEIMKREGIEILCGYPVNHLIEHAAAADIRPVMVRQERIGLHMADAISRVTSGRTIGAFCMQHGPGRKMPWAAWRNVTANPCRYLCCRWAMRGGSRISNRTSNSSQADARFCEVGRADQHCRRGRQHLPPRIYKTEKRAAADLSSSKSRPTCGNEEVPEPLNLTPVLRTRYGADPVHVKEAAALLIGAKRPVIYAGQGVHYAQAWPQLRRLAERLAIPVTTSLGGKSSFPETHPLSLGSGGLAVPRAVPKIPRRGRRNLRIGCSFTENPVRRCHAQRQNHHPFNAGPCAS